jgi:hypothetical protein
MAFMNSLESLVRRLGEATGLADLALDTEGGCTLIFDEQTVVEIRPNASRERVILSATVCDYRPERELPVLRELAAANFDGIGTGGAVLAANIRDRVVVLQHHEPLVGLEWPRFSALIAGVLDAAEFWRKRLDALPDGQSPTEVHLPPTVQLA